MEERVVVFKVKNVEYRCAVPTGREVDVDKVSNMIHNLLKHLQRESPKMVMEYLEEALAQLGVEFMLMAKALDNVKDERGS